MIQGRMKSKRSKDLKLSPCCQACSYSSPIYNIRRVEANRFLKFDLEWYLSQGYDLEDLLFCRLMYSIELKTNRCPSYKPQ